MRTASLPVHVLLGIVSGVLLTGCAAVGPDYTRPAVPTPPHYRFATASDQAESLADAPWWTVFDDATLQALIREAIASNLDLQGAVARVEQARARAGIVKAALYPQVDAAVSSIVQQTFSEDVRHSAIYGFELSWEIDLFGRIRREKEAAYALYLGTVQGRRGVLVTLVGDVATNYFQLRQLDLELLIARRTLVLNDQTVAYFQNRLQGGVSNRLEVDRAVSNRAQTAAAIPDIERQVAFVENTLSQLLGRVPGPIDRPAMGPTPPAAPSIPPGLPASLLERRPDVVQAEQLLVAANADVGAAKALFFPTIDLTGFAGAISGDLTTTLGDSGGVWSLTTGLLQPVFHGGRLRRNLELAQARVDEAVAQYRQAALNAYREVANALIAIQKLAETSDHRQVGVTALQDAADLARSRYENGLASYFEILEADRQLFEQELLLTQSQGAEFRARADLYRALGGGWQP